MYLKSGLLDYFILEMYKSNGLIKKLYGRQNYIEIYCYIGLWFIASNYGYYLTKYSKIHFTDYNYIFQYCICVICPKANYNNLITFAFVMEKFIKF